MSIKFMCAASHIELKSIKIETSNSNRVSKVRILYFKRKFGDEVDISLKKHDNNLPNIILPLRSIDKVEVSFLY